MDHIPVESSNIESIAYDQQANEMQVRFKSGSLYSYPGVPVQEYASFLDSPSKGQHFAAQIRGRFEGTKIG